MTWTKTATNTTIWDIQSANIGYLLQENGDYLLQENGDKIILEQSFYNTWTVTSTNTTVWTTTATIT